MPFSFTRVRTFTVIFSALLLFTQGCSTTRFEKVEVDEELLKKDYHHLLILGVADKKGNRMDFEDRFVAQIETLGGKATQSYTLLPKTNEIDKTSLEDAIRHTDIDAILVTHMAGIKEEEYYIPSRTFGVSYGYGYPYHNSFYSYYPYVNHYVTLPSYYNTHEVVTLETTIFDIESEKRIWSGRTNSFAPDSTEQVIDELFEMIVKDIRNRGVVK